MYSCHGILILGLYRLDFTRNARRMVTLEKEGFRMCYRRLVPVFPLLFFSKFVPPFRVKVKGKIPSILN